MPDYAGLEGGCDHFFQAVGERGKYLSLISVYFITCHSGQSLMARD